MAQLTQAVVRRGRFQPGKQEVRNHIGNSLLHIDRLRFSFKRGRQHSEFSYAQDWLDDARRFAQAPDLPPSSLRPGAAVTREKACPERFRTRHPMPRVACGWSGCTVLASARVTYSA